MSGAPSVLYDAPGPKAKARNLVYSVIFAAFLVLIAYLVIAQLAAKNQLTGEKWTPFVEGGTWVTFLLPGLGYTLLIAGLSIVIALPVGAVFGIARLSDHKWVRTIAGIIVEFFRAIPVLILMIFANEFYSEYTDVDSDNRVLFAAVTGLVLYNASVLAEVVRAGILSLPKGQTEAASALGLRKTQTMTNVLLPQAVAAMLPAIVSQLVVILKDTALAGGALSVPDLLRQANVISGNFNNTIPTYIVIGIIYVVLNFILTSFASWLQKKLSRRKKAPKGAEPLSEAPNAVTDMATGRAV
ncbi:amino acid ABC transporter permease [Amycolatopsis sp. 195334CR]|uniref:amino acid ABC transporter permease n=1 Tax=Amycolatopsis sp. 195334CR TaxID=2814588 RepID=UPI001A8C4E28|nr:amino acid ABC transporter permease [Amycolatopsis sp. 195334CR]MBN6041626.1 amino acid ABC transporter permease [Amycolatopsis sp. 195334CR]